MTLELQLTVPLQVPTTFLTLFTNTEQFLMIFRTFNADSGTQFLIFCHNH